MILARRPERAPVYAAFRAERERVAGLMAGVLADLDAWAAGSSTEVGPWVERVDALARRATDHAYAERVAWLEGATQRSEADLDELRVALAAARGARTA